MHAVLMRHNMTIQQTRLVTIVSDMFVMVTMPFVHTLIQKKVAIWLSHCNHCSHCFPIVKECNVYCVQCLVSLVVR